MDLRTARLRRNLTQEQAAELIGVTPLMISHYEMGNSIPRAEVRGRIDEIFGKIDWPNQERPLNDLEQARMWDAISIAAYRLESYEEAFELFRGESPGSIRRLTDLILKHNSVEPLLPGDVRGKGGNNGI